MRVEVLAGAERRRRWSFEEKARLAEASYAIEVSVCALARQHGIAQGLLFTWRRQAREGRLGGAEPAPVFVPVVTEPEPEAAPCVPALPPSSMALSERPRRSRRRAGVIEIDLGSGRRLKVDRDVDAEALRRVLSVLEER